ncbi:MAG: purine-cytosine permease family protein [Verrucomicrobiales bacterium]
MAMEVSMEEAAQAVQAGEEFERRPVPEEAQRGNKSFWGMYAGEHTAGTEFMIGPLFVAYGVAFGDLILGLLLGNLAAVLTWRYLTANIATRLRVTLYYKLEKICGRRLVTIYNLANGLLFCFLAGAMVTVSATAVGVPFPGVAMPALNDTMPTGFSWCLIVLVIGAVMTFVAMKGYGLVSKVGHLAAPWMFLIFVACGLVTLPKLESLEVAKILTGTPLGNNPKIGFWGVFFFAWFCNGAMHLGMSDLSILRFAKKPSAGWAPAAGMYLGHFVAWICAALLYSLQLQRYGEDASVAPGPMVFEAVGWAGLICVVIAGWTTANPTIYRAGLAFQGIMPKVSRTTTTLLAGLVCTVAGLFPAFAMKLLDFVGIYVLILAPVGAIIVVDVFLAKRLGLVSDPAEKFRSSFNVAALVAWIAPAAIGFWAVKHFAMPLPTYVTLPVYVLSGLLYIVLSKLWQAKAVA